MTTNEYQEKLKKKCQLALKKAVDAGIDPSQVRGWLETTTDGFILLRSHAETVPVFRVFLMCRSPVLRSRMLEIYNAGTVPTLIDVSQDMKHGATLVKALKVLHGDVAFTQNMQEEQDLSEALKNWGVLEQLNLCDPLKESVYSGQ